ncbi:hypothetical protein [Streptomyces cylindrosporus]|uniref:Uncharacterized protein n=1 Tax=Streptomyces cylindrosporus TaxID=2927583 RepID=A0ABS9YQD0_9ACTN|nr:hypothetical protein [Streptomyces cylindrosporus]MCI3279119.1 hypothetical protein [Streptomyces cylindrosporus]
MADQTPERPHIPNPRELAELLLHQLQHLDPDGIPALMVTLRLADGTYIGDANLSLPAEDGLVDAVISFSNYMDCTGGAEPAAAPLPLAEDDLTDADVDDVLTGFATLLGSEDGEL